MQFHYPSSFLKLILAAFALVTLPLILSTGHGTLSVSRLSDQSEDALRRAVSVTQASWMLVQQLTIMERAARQLVLLGDAGLLEGYGKARTGFLAAAGALQRLPLDRASRERLDELVAGEAAVYAALGQDAGAGEAARHALERFARLAELAQAILSGSGRSINREMQALQTAAAQVRRSLLLESLSVIPVALLLAGAFAFLIARPIRQIEAAIHRLGRGEFDRNITVGGPRDLQYLGRRLEWLRTRLLDLEAQRSKLLHHVSHELKTPLAALREGTQLLADGIVGSPTPQQAEILHILRQSTLQLQKRIEDLLAFKLTQSRAGPAASPRVNLAQVVARTARAHRPAVMRKGLRLVMDLPPVEVIGEARALATVADNLLSNAIKYSPPGATIQVSLRRENLLAVLEVRDEGPGIAPEERARVFEPFYQGRAAHENGVAGTGLGLAIARETVLAHGGSIEVVEAEAGAHLRVLLPASVEEAARA